jgi:hypothetical protein
MHRFFLVFAIAVSISVLTHAQDCINDTLYFETEAGPQPFTSLNLNNDDCQFQFAVVTDRTGGHRPGI